MLKTIFLSSLALVSVASSASAVQLFYDKAQWIEALGSSYNSAVIDTFSNPIHQNDILLLDSGVLSTNSQPPMFTDNSVFNGRYNNAVSVEDRATAEFIYLEFPHEIQAFGVELFDGSDRNDVDALGIFSTFGESFLGFNFHLPNSFLGLIMTEPERTDYISLVFTGQNGWDVFELDNLTFIEEVKRTKISEPSVVIGLGSVLLAIVLIPRNNKME
jgi:hypothetical protein